MTDENRLARTTEIRTVSNLFDKLDARATMRRQVSAQVDILLDKLADMGRQVSADETRDITIASYILTTATEQDNKFGIAFATDLLGCLISGKSAEVRTEIQEKYKDLDLTGLMPPEAFDILDVEPNILKSLQGGSTVSSDWMKGVVIEEPAEVISAVQVPNPEVAGNLEAMSKKYPSIGTLFSSDTFWIDGDDGHEYTQLKNIAVLITNKDWNESDMAKAIAAFRQTILKKWFKTGDKEGKGEFGRKFKGYHGNQFLSKELALDLVLFMNRFLRLSSFSTNQLTTDYITNWPFTKNINSDQDRKKKVI